MLIRSVIKLFESGNVCVTGLRGTGKDVLFGNVISRRNAPYVSNIDYGGYYTKVNLKDITLSDNKFTNFIEGDLHEYVYPYARGSDVYISDVGVYMPSQFCNELNKLYQGLSSYQALSRQVSRNNFHINVQNLNRAWDKIREQSDIYIRCRRCFVLFKGKLVIQAITTYDKYQSCLDRVKPCRIRVPMLNKEAQTNARIYRDNFFNQHGEVRNRILIYRNRSKHDTYYFERLLRDGGHTNEDYR